MTRPQFSVSRETTLKAQRLQREAKLFERRLRSKVKQQRLGGWKFRRQHPFGPYILDFFVEDAKLAVELDGDQHGLDGAFERDARRDRAFVRTRLVFPPLEKGRVREGIRLSMPALAARNPSPGPSLFKGGGEKCFT